jgi:hypothetical protein
MRRARSCYDHLAGELGVALFDGLMARGAIEARGGALSLTPRGAGFVEDLGVEVAGLGRSRRPTCKACLDWSERRSHLGGALGKALLNRVLAAGWAHRMEGARTVIFTADGLAKFERTFGSNAAAAA